MTSGARGVALRTTSTQDALIAELRGQILSGQLGPGEPLPEVALAETFGVARPTVRSALQALVARRLLRRDSGRSATVPVLTEEDVRDLFFVRAPLEMEAVAAIARGNLPVTEAELRLEEMEALPDDAGWAARVEAHTAFHIALIDAAGSPRLSRMYPALQEEMQLCLAQLHASYPGPHDLAREHRELLEQVTSTSGEQAREAIREHLARAVRNFVDQR